MSFGVAYWILTRTLTRCFLLHVSSLIVTLHWHSSWLFLMFLLQCSVTGYNEIDMSAWCPNSPCIWSDTYNHTICSHHWRRYWEDVIGQVSNFPSCLCSKMDSVYTVHKLLDTADDHIWDSSTGVQIVQHANLPLVTLCTWWIQINSFFTHKLSCKICIEGIIVL